MLDEPITPAYVIAAFELATETLLSLPFRGHSTRLAQGRNDVVQEMIEAYGYTPEAPRRPVPQAAHITAMDEIHSWLRFVPNKTTRRIVGLRSILRANREPKSWKSIATLVGANDCSVKTWHGKGIALIVVALNQGRAGLIPDLDD